MATPSQVSAQVIAAQAKIRGNFEVVVRDVVARGVMELALRNTDLTDHTLADLRRLDHPYARRHGRNRIHDDRLIHRQSGILQEEFRDSTVPLGDRILYTLRNTAFYWPYLRDGTETMRPRQMNALLNRQFGEQVWPKVLARLRAEFRAAFQ
jgi:hypothetical protein